MSVNQIEFPDGVYFITFICAGWLTLFEITNDYHAVYKWFDYMKQQGHYIIGHIIMPNHVYAVIAFSNTGKSIISIVGNGKRFMAYELVKLLKQHNKKDILVQLAQWVNYTDKKEIKSTKYLNLRLTEKNTGQLNL